MSETTTGAPGRVIVTGGSSGIGKATVELFRSIGSAVVSLDLDVDPRDEHAIRTDVSDATSVVSSVNSAVGLLGGLDAVVNIAGIQRSGAIEEFEEADWDDQLRINVKSCFLMAKYCVPFLRESKQAAFVTTASLAGLKGFPGVTGYSASKGAVIAFTRTLATELASDGIRCNCLCPGWVDTPFNDPVIAFEGGAKAHQEAVRTSVPLRREAQPIELAKAAVFLASEESSYMTGQNLVVDGGLSA